MQELHEATRERERPHAQMRTATAQLLQEPADAHLGDAVATAMIKELASRVCYAAALKGVGWPVPDHLLIEAPEEHRP
ncbi:hypothetical protein [Actinopolymorpha pittospori]|uniref:Uncharacterized protein n=2 Tax=Actinopolymorpha pittospori TaxID=648752 RepID=A0A927R6V6_9ACTN|nr:hypothetical protein [Actinopolymorpha pittospori]